MLKKGQRAPDFTLRDAGGGRVATRALTASGPVVLFFIRSTACTFCQGELARLASRHAEFVGAGASVAAIVCEPVSRSEDWYRETRPPYPLLVDEDRSVARHFGVYKALGFDSFRMAQPSVFVLDPAGVIQHAHRISEEDAASSLDDALALARSLSNAKAPLTEATGVGA